MKVLFPNVLIKPDPKQEEKGLIIGLKDLDIPTSGKIVDAPKKSSYSIGDRVTMDPLAGHPVEIDGDNYLVINEMDVFGEII